MRWKGINVLYNFYYQVRVDKITRSARACQNTILGRKKTKIMVILGEKKKFSKHIIFFQYVKYIFKKKMKKIFLKTWSAKYSPRTFRIPCLTPHLHIHIIYKKAANISHTIPRSSYAKCSRTFTGLRPPKYSHRTKSSVQYVPITYT